MDVLARHVCTYIRGRVKYKTHQSILVCSSLASKQFSVTLPNMASAPAQEAIDYLPSVRTDAARLTPSDDNRSEKSSGLDRDGEKATSLEAKATVLDAKDDEEIDELSGSQKVLYGPDGEPIIQNGEHLW